MTVANGSLSLDGTTISEIEAKRFIVSYQQPDTITADSLAKSMTWPLDPAHYCIQDGIVPEEDPEAAAVAAKAKTHFTDHQELLHALQSGLIDQNGRLLKPRAAFVRKQSGRKVVFLKSFRPLYV